MEENIHYLRLTIIKLIDQCGHRCIINDKPAFHNLCESAFEWDKSFQLKWLVPKSIFTIECPTCSPYDYPNHFDRTHKRFQDVVTVYKCGLNYM